MRFRSFDGGSGGTLTFGGGDRKVMSQSAGALLGLIRNVNLDPAVSTIPVADLRPTALAQLGLSSFRLDAPGRMLTLSSAPLLHQAASSLSAQAAVTPSPARRNRLVTPLLDDHVDDALPLVDPRPFGDGVEHICCRVADDEIVLNGVPMRSSRPVLCVFDTGLTGCVLSQSLVDELGLQQVVTPDAPFSLADAAQRTGVRALSLQVCTEGGRRVVLGSNLRASPLFYTQAVRLGWFNDVTNGPHVVALGQCVLGRGTLTVDGPQRRATWSAES